MLSCPICDGYESRDRRIAVIGYGDHGLGEAVFIARTYSDDVTLLTLGQRLELAPEQREKAQEHRFDVLYSALGLKYRTDLALALGARHDPSGALIVDDHSQTTVKGLYAAGDIVRGLDQIV